MRTQSAGFIFKAFQLEVVMDLRLSWTVCEVGINISRLET